MTKSLVKAALGRVGVSVMPKRRFDRLVGAERAAIDLELIRRLPLDTMPHAIDVLKHSKSQYRQDVFALAMCDFKLGGYFVEFGATDGETISNTWLLEKRFGWTGIVAEPARIWRDRLATNRDCEIETDCVWTTTGLTLEFAETEWAEISTLASFAGSDMHAGKRKGSRTYPVRTISLNDMLAKHGAPDEIDYLSIDTEGSEFEILAALNFARYRFKVITCEHNYTPSREKIHTLLTSQGYQRKLEDVSACDDWYVRE